MKHRLVVSLIAATLLIDPNPALSKTSDLPPQDDPEVLMALQLDRYVLNQGFMALQKNQRILLPLGELSRSLGIALNVSPQAKSAEGFILREDRSFFLDCQKGQVVIHGKAQPVNLEAVEIQNDDIYVDKALLCEWFPMDLEINQFESFVGVKPREPLPIQLRLERERRFAESQALSELDPGYPLQPPIYQLWNPPVIDQTLSMNTLSNPRGISNPSVNYSTSLTGDLLFMTGNVFFAGSEKAPLSTLLFNLGRKDPESKMLGALKASEFSLGDVNSPGLPLVSSSNSGRGAVISNYPLYQASQFDRHDFRGYLPPNWEVELYQNGILIGYQNIKENGLFAFDNVPLVMGMNEFRLVYYGPQGQVREEYQRFNINSTQIPPGEQRYRVSSNFQEDGKLRSSLQYDLGIHKQLSASIGFANLPKASATKQYGEFGLRGFWREWFLHGDLAMDLAGGSIGGVGAQTRLGPVDLTLNHTRLNHYVSEMFPESNDPLLARSEMRLIGNSRLSSSSQLVTSLNIKHDQKESGINAGQISNRLGFTFQGVSVSNQLNWNLGQNLPGLFSEGTLQLGTRWNGVGIRGGISYQPKALNNTECSLDMRMDRDTYLNCGLSYSLYSRQAGLNTGLNKNLGSFALGVNANYAGGNFALGTTLSFGLSHDPQQGRWNVQPQGVGSSGAVLAHVFLDSNLNGIRDSEDKSLAGVPIMVNGQDRGITQTNGCALIANLPANQPIDLSLSEALEDPLWVPQNKGIRMFLQPGSVINVDFPIITTGEVNGTTYLLQKGSKTHAGGLKIELIKKNGEIIKSTQSAYDGFFNLTAVPPGQYTLNVSSEQGKELDLNLPQSREIQIFPEGGYIDGADLVLKSRNDKPILLKGRVIFNQSTPQNAFSLRLKKLNETKTLYEKTLDDPAEANPDGFHQFEQYFAGCYKAYYRQGIDEVYKSGSTTVGYLQSADVVLEEGDNKTIGDIDLFWNTQPWPINTSIKANSVVDFTFTTKGIPGHYKYKIALKNPSGKHIKTPDWIIPRERKVSIPVVLPSETGTYSYQILFRSMTGSIQADGYTGESGGTANIYFSLN